MCSLLNIISLSLLLSYTFSLSLFLFSLLVVSAEELEAAREHHNDHVHDLIDAENGLISEEKKKQDLQLIIDTLRQANLLGKNHLKLFLLLLFNHLKFSLFNHLQLLLLSFNQLKLLLLFNHLKF